MAQIDDLTAAIEKLQTDVAALIAAQAPAPAVDLTAAIAQVTAIDATVTAATPPKP